MSHYEPVSLYLLLRKLLSEYKMYPKKKKKIKINKHACCQLASC